MANARYRTEQLAYDKSETVKVKNVFKTWKNRTKGDIAVY